MNDFRDFASARTNEMFITRIGWWRPYYELSDDQFTYARLSYKGTFKRYAIIESATGLFTIKRKSLMSRTLMFNRGEDETIGELQPSTWKRDVQLKMDNGFEATYLFKKLFSRAYTLTNDAYGDILDVKQVTWGIKKPFTVNFPADNFQTGKPDLAILTMIGVHFILYRQQQAAAAS